MTIMRNVQWPAGRPVGAALCEILDMPVLYRVSMAAVTPRILMIPSSYKLLVDIYNVRASQLHEMMIQPFIAGEINSEENTLNLSSGTIR